MRREGRMEITQHFVTFYSPGTIVAEATTKPIDSWNVKKAMSLARKVKERHGATPYAFQFSTRGREKDELDSRVIKQSGTYFLGGKILTISDIKRQNDPKDRILIENMECNGWKKVVRNDNSWRWTQPLKDEDQVLQYRVRKAREGVPSD
jgi:hypothetical protein